jgi:predicted nucleotidyltransferase
MKYETPLTAYPEINEAIETMANTIHAALGSKFVGFYVYGSLALGDFDPQKSDIDALVVTAEKLNNDEFEKLKQLHTELFESGSKWVREIELSYIPQDEMKKYDRTHPPHIRLHEGSFVSSFWHGDDWVLHRHVLREQGIVVVGPHPNTMIDPVSPQDILHAVAVGIVQNWWEGKVLQEPDRLHDDMYQASGVLAMCRALFTLETGELASKKASAIWAQKVLDEPFKSLIGRAVAWKPGTVMNDYQGTIDFIRYTANRTRQSASANSMKTSLPEPK